MPQTTITINGNTILSDPLDHWQKRPPEALAALIKPGTNPPPYSKAMMIALAEAAAKNQPINITIATFPDGGWTLSVTPT